MSRSTHKLLTVDPFCYRQFREFPDRKHGYTGTIFDISIAEFEDIVNHRFQEQNLRDGYASFCKHLFVQNDFTDAKANVLRINDSNIHLLRSKYEARNDQELPVLVRYFPKELVMQQQQETIIDLPKAKYLDLILYSREQIRAENTAQCSTLEETTSKNEEENAPWGIVSIKAQDVDHELPMNPITIMRNALGKEQGGSGVPIENEKYMESVNYWKDHAVIS